MQVISKIFFSKWSQIKKK